MSMCCRSSRRTKTQLCLLAEVEEGAVATASGQGAVGAAARRRKSRRRRKRRCGSVESSPTVIRASPGPHEDRAKSKYETLPGEAKDRGGAARWVGSIGVGQLVIGWNRRPVLVDAAADV